MNAVSLYVTTCRMVFQSCTDDSGAWADIYRLLSYLRQALSCCVCEKLLMIPFSTNVCHHCVCKACIGGKRRLKPSCSNCGGYEKFSEDVTIRILLQCYKRLCEYLNDSVQHRKWANLNGGTKIHFADMVREGANLSDDFQYSDPDSSSCLRGFDSLISLPPDGTTSVDPDHKSVNVVNGDSDRTVNGNSSVYTSVTVAGSNSTKLMIKRTTTETSGSDIQDLKSEVQAKRAKFGDNTISSSKNKLKRKGCGCGLATANPGKLTCCGQRCPCYVDSKACQDCRCRGCRNPLSLSINNQHTPSQLSINNIKVEIASDEFGETTPLNTTSDIN